MYGIEYRLNYSLLINTVVLLDGLCATKMNKLPGTVCVCEMITTYGLYWRKEKNATSLFVLETKGVTILILYKI